LVVPQICEMGDHNTRLQEMRREIDGLKGSMDGVDGSVAELSRVVDTKVTDAMSEIKTLLVTMMGGQ
ncbi:hypothetical protein HAX54_039495, partial [Datura stramonium]|nr:hypothetical protein [Datura stramonium]